MGLPPSPLARPLARHAVVFTHLQVNVLCRRGSRKISARQLLPDICCLPAVCHLLPACRLPPTARCTSASPCTQTEGQVYDSGNNEPRRGFGHIAIFTDDVYKASAAMEAKGVAFKKRPDEGRMKGLAFAYDPDGACPI